MTEPETTYALIDDVAGFRSRIARRPSGPDDVPPTAVPEWGESSSGGTVAIDDVVDTIFPDPEMFVPANDELPCDVALTRRAARMIPPSWSADGGAAIGVDVVDGRLIAAWDHRPSPADEASLARAVGMPVDSRRVSTARFTELQAAAFDLLAESSSLPPIEGFIQAAIDQRASDLHLRVGAPPSFRVSGVLAPIPDTPILSADDMDKVVEYLLGRLPPEGLSDHDSSMSYHGTHFRVNVFRQRSNFGAVLRLISADVPSFDSLRLPPIIAGLSERRAGIIIVSGVTGSGKSTTLASMIDIINQTRQENILTLEDPIEYVYTNKRSLVAQREIGHDTESYAAGLRAALREDPDVILVGEMRDFETIEAAIRAAETGHLVFSTLHAGSTTQAIDRMVGAYPAEQQGQIRVQLASTLVSIICQKLVPATQPGTRRVATEVMVVSDSNRHTIINPENNSIGQQLSARVDGQHLMDHSLAELVVEGEVDFDMAKSFANQPEHFAEQVNTARSRVSRKGTGAVADHA
ncbi:MAG: PilT/PilU family type 4a pilus ATPase [Actinomycetota bacterium]|jgi:twitching motility protein PilT|nr:PilT/PilU family type 4a pilus ATPase [Actinomycetota bacterium]